MTDHTREAGPVECAWCDGVARGYASPDPGYVESSPSCGEHGLNFRQDSALFDDWLAAHVAAVVAEKDTEIERLRAMLHDVERVDVRLREAHTALGVIAALVENADDYVPWCDNPVIETPVIAAILADSAGAITKREQEVRAEALREFADTCGVYVGDEDDEWWSGYRQAQRECLLDAVARADALTESTQ